MKYLLILGCIFGFSQTYSQIDTTKLFAFGHSLIDHRPPAIPTPSNETTVPHWMYLMSQHEGYNFKAGGQYGFLPQHANVPPIAQWGYDIVPGVWDSDNEPFSDANITHVLITAGNFVQWQGPDEEYPGDPGITPINATETISDWVNMEESTAKIYIYENWPDMAPYLANGFPPTPSEFQNYNDYTLGEFHDWWLEYHDSLLVNRPNLNIRMIPVGPTIGKILTEVMGGLIPIGDLYEDDAPHGQSSIYFLAAMITHMAIYEEKLSVTFDPGATVLPTLVDSLESIIDFAWTELINFNDVNGDNRVFFNYLNSVVNIELDQNCINVYPNPVSDYFNIIGTLDDYFIEILDSAGDVYQSINETGNHICIDVKYYPSGQYFVVARHRLDTTICVQKIIKE